ncbi:97 kDa heat shock protein, partial [Orchesella cincta]
MLTGDGGEGNAITRNDFEEACATFFEDMEQALLTCLEDSEIHVADLHSVELLGGTSQIPAISSLIERVLGRAPSKTLNPSEAVARGCAMQCAILSPSTSNLVRSNYQIIDVQPYPIELKWIFPSGQIGGTEIFALHSPVPDVSSSSLMCPAAKKTAFKVAYGDNEFHPRKTIGKFIIDLNHENDHPCVFTVHFSLNIHGMLSVDKATVDQVVGLHMGETFSIMDLNSDEEMPAGAADLLEVGASTEVPREEHSSIRDVPVDSRPVHGLSRSELEAMILEESRFVALDKLEEERQARRTNLVATMLCMKGVLDGYLKRFVNEEQDRLDEYFTNLEHWLLTKGRMSMERLLIRNSRI